MYLKDVDKSDLCGKEIMLFLKEFKEERKAKIYVANSDSGAVKVAVENGPFGVELTYDELISQASLIK